MARWNGEVPTLGAIGKGRLQFEVLGALRVISDGTEVPVNGPKRRALLVRLLLDANQPVTAATLIEDLWEGAPPPSAAATLHSHVAHVRRAVGDRLRTEPGGYLLEVPEGDLDAAVFASEVAEARAVLGQDPRRALDLATRAQARWRGVPFADAAGAPWAAAAAGRLEDVRVGGIGCEIEARLATGDPAGAAARAEAAVADHPLREHLWALLVTALYRAGRQADALRACSRLRAALVEELGIDPSPELQALERAVLEHDPSLAGPAPTVVVARPARGPLTFLMSDVVGSTRMWEDAPDAMRTALARHDEVLRGAIADHGGEVFATGGDGFAAAFPSAADAASAAVAAQAQLAAEVWPSPCRIEVRMGLHTGAAQQRDGDFFGPALNRCARLMAAANGGQVLCTGATAELLRDEGGFPLVDLGSHRLRDLPAPVPVFQVGGGTFPPLRSLDRASSNLPTAVTELVGRRREADELLEAVRSHRLVTLTGVGGVGKTRLAVATADAIAPEHVDGAWLVDLAAVGRGADVAPAVLAAVGAPPTGGDPLLAVRAFLAERRLVLVLDNCEHVLDDAAALAQSVLASASDVHMVATSREPLGVEGEVVRPVRSLGVPGEDAALPDVERAAAVQLFVDRARAAAAGFRLHEGNAEAVAMICRRLDGVPLALELAAARVRTMAVEEIARRLDDRFRVLTGARRAQERHRTLQATVSWSHDLLSPDERSVFAQLSVFPATFTLAAAAAVATVDGLDGQEVQDAVLRLVDRSLVVYEPDTGRYRLLETLRQFAADRLAETGSSDAVLDRYLRNQIELVAAVGPGIADERHDAAMATLVPELDNIRAVADVLRTAGRWADLGQLALHGWSLFTQLTPIEGRRWLGAALDAGALADPAERAEALGAMAMMAANVADHDEGTRHAEAALALAEAHGLPHPPWAHFALSLLDGFAHEWSACLEHAQATIAGASDRHDELARILGVAQTTTPLVRLGRPDEAARAATDALSAAVRLRNGTALTAALACVCSAFGSSTQASDLDRARRLLDEYADALPWPPGGLNRAWLLTYRAWAESGRSAWLAVRHGVEAVRSADRASPYALAGALEVLALACARAGYVDTAHALLGYSKAQDAPTFDSSNTGALERELRAALDAHAPPAPGLRVPSDRRQLMALLDEVERALVPAPDDPPDG